MQTLVFEIFLCYVSDHMSPITYYILCSTSLMFNFNLKEGTFSYA
jgi:hypothetical protein